MLDRTKFLNEHLLALKEDIEDIDDMRFLVNDIEVIKQECVTIDLEIPVIEVSLLMDRSEFLSLFFKF